MLEIFVDQISERLIYTLDFVFGDKGISYKLNNDFYTFQLSTHQKLNYSEREFENIPQIIPATILFDEAIFIYALDQGVFQNEICLSFNKIVDPLASIFYVLSRMEEYNHAKDDEHGRFKAKNSIQHKFGWLEKAVCDRWALDFILYLTKNCNLHYEFELPLVEIIPTFDIDNTFAYLEKEGLRKWLSIAKDYKKKDKLRIAERKLVLSGASFDPYDTFDYIKDIFNREFNVKMFWHLGDYARYDRNISYKNIKHRTLIKDMFNLIGDIGIHPSYKSNSYVFDVEIEKNRLKEIITEEVNSSRQHFLKVSIPKTYKTLLQVGIKNDYTMGYADKIGFRAGTAKPFYWYDLDKNQKTDLLVHPFVYMDGTLNEYLEISPNESMKIIDHIFQEVSKFGGDFIFIWHNETIGNYGKWAGWKDVLEFTLNLKNK